MYITLKTIIFVANSIALSLFIFIFILMINNHMPYGLLLQEAIPFFHTSESLGSILIPNIDLCDACSVFNDQTNSYVKNKNTNDDKINKIKQNKNSKNKANIVNTNSENKNNLDEPSQSSPSKSKTNQYNFDLTRLNDLDYLASKLYNVDKKTKLTHQDFNINKFISMPMKLNKSTSNNAKVLIFHTHSTETYKDSNNISDGVISLGKKLCDLLNNSYNIKTIHHIKSYDIVNGINNKFGAYERMEKDIKEIIKQQPDLEVLIDLHRDGVENNAHLVKNINGKPTAKIMFVNGICRLLDNNNNLSDINGITNPYTNQNLAFSFQMQMKLEELYPGITRKIYVNAYRYSLHMLPKSLLIEVGAQTNTRQEALNAIAPLAYALYQIIS
jgi:stage II sporulation protein P